MKLSLTLLIFLVGFVILNVSNEKINLNMFVRFTRRGLWLQVQFLFVCKILKNNVLDGNGKFSVGV